MLKFKHIIVTLAAVLLAACGGSDDNTLVNGNAGGGGGGSTANVGSLTLLTSSSQILSDGSNSATVTAIVRDTNNTTMTNVQVVFSTDSGSLQVPDPSTTGPNGQVAAELTTAGNSANRTITVTAMTGNLTDTVTVDVVGTQLTVSGPASLPLGDVGNFNVLLADASGNGIGGELITIASSNGNAISATPLTTDSDGQASFMLTAAGGGVDTLTATGLGLTSMSTVTVSADQFAFSAPAPATEIPLNTAQAFTVQWLVGGVPVADGSIVNFSSTRGTVSAAQVTTTGGNASITVTATNAGPAVVTATNSGGTSTQRIVEFVATTPSELELQASPFTIGPQEQSAITAIVRDAAGNLVKNQVVTFTLDDITGGSLSVAQDVTDSQGRAQTFYTSNLTTSASDGVTVTAAVQGTAISDSVNLTVAQRELFITIGTGNEIDEPNTAQYRKEYVVQISDSQGNGVAGVDVQLNILSLDYFKGTSVFAGNWSRSYSAGPCLDEDANRNGVLDLIGGVPGTGEDANGSGLIEAGNIAVVSVQGVGGGTATTDASGFALVDIFYPQEYAFWVTVRLEATASVDGTEFAEPTTFMLTGAAADFDDADVSPPGFNSPFGVSANCADTL